MVEPLIHKGFIVPFCCENKEQQAHKVETEKHNQ